MKWNHLPVAGGLYDQDPILLDQWAYLFELQAEEREKEQERQERERKNNTKLR